MAQRASKPAKRNLDEARRPAEAEGTRARILLASLRVFGERGYAGAGMREIAAAADLTEGALYHYFAGKEELLRALLDDRVARLRLPGADSSAVSDLFASLPLDQMLQHIADHMLSRAAEPEQQSFMRLLLSEGTRDPAIARVFQEHFLRPMREMLRRALDAQKQRGRIRPEIDCDLLARQIHATAAMQVLWQFIMRGREHDPIDLGTYMRQAIDTVLRGVSPAGGAP